MQHITILQRIGVSIVGLIALGTSGCGGDLGAVAPGGGGTGSVPPTTTSTSFVAIGAASKTSPLEVNGITVATNNATVEFETNDDDSQGLQPGMIVRVVGTRGNDPAQGTASEIRSGAELRGAVDTIDRPTLTFSSLGIAVDIVSTTRYIGFGDGIASIAKGDSVQVHGYPTGDNRIRATLIKKRASTTLIKVTGTLTATAPCTTCATPSGGGLQIGTLVVRPSSTSSPGGSVPPVGTLVKATGSLDANGVLNADSIVPYEGAPRANGTGVVIQGVLANVSKAADEFVVSGYTIRIDANTQVIDNLRFGATLAPGNLLDIVGEQRGNVIAASKIVRQ
jgi:hypothetical protein